MFHILAGLLLNAIDFERALSVRHTNIAANFVQLDERTVLSAVMAAIEALCMVMVSGSVWR